MDWIRGWGVGGVEDESQASNFQNCQVVVPPTDTGSVLMDAENIRRNTERGLHGKILTRVSDVLNFKYL